MRRNRDKVGQKRDKAGQKRDNIRKKVPAETSPQIGIYMKLQMILLKNYRKITGKFSPCRCSSPAVSYHRKPQTVFTRSAPP
jgi:hypothetical protein